ncbi:MAG TPA: 30S ribosomal protein S16 [Candidatus Magasanikbacteria bacterium]|nr:30S ribosomal protein S16 [Candidatus Magasanikbacteria bacterium]
MLMIRLQRIGKRKQPTYRLIVNEKGRDTQAKSLEILGHYSPTENPKVIQFDAERIKYWISKGAQASGTVNNLLIKLGIIEGKKMKSVTITNKRRAKMGAKKAEAEAKMKEVEQAAAQAKAAAEEAAKAAAQAEAEKPVEEVKVEEAPAEEKKEV